MAPYSPYSAMFLRRTRSVRSVARILIVLVSLPLACSSLAGGCSGQGSSPAPLTPLSAERLKDLQAAMGAVGREETLQRALKESGPYLGQFPVLVESILKGSAWEHRHNSMSIISTLSKARGQGIQAIIDFYRDAPAGKRWILRCAMCRIGKEARAAAPVLREEIEKEETSAEEKMSIKVALAALGEAAPADLGEIADAISESRGPGLEALCTMSCSGYNPWVSERVERSVVKMLEKPRLTPDNLEQDLRDEACFVLATFAERTDTHVLQALEADYGRALKDSDCPAVLTLRAGLYLAKADPNRRRAMMLSLLKGAPEPLSCWQLRPLMERICEGIPEEDLLWVADALLSEQKHEPLSAALVILYAVGPRARPAVPRLVSLIRHTDDASTRTAAAETLGMIADPLDLPLIESLASDAALSDDAKKAVQECIRAVKLHD